MLKYVQDSGRTARIWGSLTQCSGKTPVRSKDVQMIYGTLVMRIWIKCMNKVMI